MRVSTFCEEVDLRESYFLTKFSPSSVTGEFAPLLLSGRLANIDGGGQIAGDSTRGRFRFTCEDDLSKCLFEQLPLLVVVTLGRLLLLGPLSVGSVEATVFTRSRPGTFGPPS